MENLIIDANACLNIEGNLTMTFFKYQGEFANDLTESWLNGNHTHVCDAIRNLKNKAQASYIASMITLRLAEIDFVKAKDFCDFMHPNCK